MLALLIILIAIILVMLGGGIWFYIKKFKILGKESKEFMQIVFEVLKDRKVTVAQKEKFIKEYTDVTTVIKDIRDKFVFDSDGLGDDLKELYNKIKSNIKKRKK